MAVVNIINKNIKFDVKENTLLSDAIREGINIETPCEGKGVCGKCKVKVKGELSPVLESEKRFIKEGERLACMARITGDVEVEVTYSLKDIKSIDSGYRRKYSVGDNIGKRYGVAIDLGTTGVSGYLVDYSIGDVIEKYSTVNRQVEYGADVLSRAEFQISREDGGKLLQKKVVETINFVLDKLSNSDPYILNNINGIYIAGNTIMLHLLAGKSVESLVKAPYESVFLDTYKINSNTISIKVNSDVILLPSISSYVGADITAGMFACNFENRNNSIYIDIGTNGEIGINSSGEIYTTATAAGPALEGSNIECGMRAEDGAIDGFKIEGDNIVISTINNSPACGICGSGIIDIIAEFIKHKIILKTGKINKDNAEKYFKVEDKKIYITNGIYISQEDIRAFQLAKGAIISGINTLCRRVKLEEVKEFLVGGSFGYHLNEESLRRVGIVPGKFNGSVKFVGNSSLEGAFISSINEEYIQEMRNLSKKAKSINLSLDSEFQSEFINNLRF
ncbi:MAG: ASKHA domain-containing protein [Clostridium sp.]